jgi:hypothetical protein
LRSTIEGRNTVICLHFHCFVYISHSRRIYIYIYISRRYVYNSHNTYTHFTHVASTLSCFVYCTVPYDPRSHFTRSVHRTYAYSIYFTRITYVYMLHVNIAHGRRMHVSHGGTYIHVTHVRTSSVPSLSIRVKPRACTFYIVHFVSHGTPCVYTSLGTHIFCTQTHTTVRIHTFHTIRIHILHVAY